MKLEQNLTRFFLILSLLIIGSTPLLAQDTSSSDFCQIAEMTTTSYKIIPVTNNWDTGDIATIRCDMAHAE